MEQQLNLKFELSLADQDKFKSWLELDINAITWEGRYKKEFNHFWSILFPSDVDVGTQLKKILFSRSLISTGPMLSWFQWIYHKMVCFTFIYKGLNIHEISKSAGLREAEVGLIIRDFFVELYPHMEEQVNEYLHIGTITSDNILITYQKLSKKLNVSGFIRGSSGDDVMTSLEITLFKDWAKLYNDILEHHKKNEINLEKIKGQVTFGRQLRFLRELVVLFLLGGLVILGLKFGNKWYEDYLVDKITIFEPNFFWLDKSLSFKESRQKEVDNIELNYSELENLEKIESQNIFDVQQSTQRFDGESDVVLTSVDALPKDFTTAELEQSEYEELKKGGYRNSRYGRQKAYRVMITSVDAKEITSKLRDVLKNYSVKKADNVIPGTQIPGGFYFNLYVPRNLLKDFLLNVSQMDEAQILESKTRFGGPYGMNKVFIWIKSL